MHEEMPLTMQLVASVGADESGLAAVATVASAYGVRVRLVELQLAFPAANNGDPGQLVDVAGHLGLAARVVNLQLDALGHLALPCVLHWQLQHFVVLAKLEGGVATVLDPATGEHRVGLSEIAAHFSGVAVELHAIHDFQPRPALPRVGLRQLIGAVPGLRPLLAQIGVLSLLLQATLLLSPLLLQWVVDKVLLSSDRELLTLLGLGFGLVLLLQIGIGILRDAIVQYLGARVGLQWMNNVLGQLLGLPMRFFEGRRLAQLQSMLVAARDVQRLLGGRCIGVLVDAAMALTALVLMLLYNWALALVSVVAMLLYGLVRGLTGRRQQEGRRRQLAAEACAHAYELELLRGMRSLKLAGKEAQRRSMHGNLLAEASNAQALLARLELGCSGAGQLLRGLECIVAIWIGASLVMGQVLSLGMLIAYLAYKDQFTTRMAALIDTGLQLRLARLQVERVAELMLAVPEANNLPLPLAAGAVRLEVENLSFRHGSTAAWMLKDCSFSIQAGESLAIVGVSGCGKTTLLKLLLGLLQPTSGSIRIDGRELTPRELRRLSGVVMQDDSLFAGSIADNIGFFEPIMDLPRIEAAARLAGLHEDIVAGAMGYHALVDEMGDGLSAGQRQRLLLARALYRQAGLLLLDEATCQLDAGSERQVVAMLGQLRMTRLILSQRPGSAASADRVLAMQPGGRLQELPISAGEC